MSQHESSTDIHLFTEEVKDVRPLPAQDRAVIIAKKPKPIPKKFTADNQQLADTLSDHYIPEYTLESDEKLRYLRDGHSPDILRKLRHGHWLLQAHIDLHGLVSDEARLYVLTFINDCKSRGLRCVRIVHGKGLGSHKGQPVIKQRLRGWLMQIEVVIAYTEAKQQDGGSGAVIVLLKA